MKNIRIVLILSLVLGILSACSKQEETKTDVPPGEETAYPVAPIDADPSEQINEQPVTTQTYEPTIDPNVYPVNMPLSLEQTASAVIKALEASDMLTLAQFAHPSRGVRFTPYSYVSDTDLVFSQSVLPTLMSDPTVYHWGLFDGSGFPIDLTFSEYYAKFIYSADFANPEQVAYNAFLGSGNSINNLEEFYPGAEFVEYHFSGFNKQYEGMDWQSLRLVFSHEGGQYFLIGIVHAQWTI
jgi:hypothetical protein